MAPLSDRQFERLCKRVLYGSEDYLRDNRSALGLISWEQRNRLMVVIATRVALTSEDFGWMYEISDYEGVEADPASQLHKWHEEGRRLGRRPGLFRFRRGTSRSDWSWRNNLVTAASPWLSDAQRLDALESAVNSVTSSWASRHFSHYGLRELPRVIDELQVLGGEYAAISRKWHRYLIDRWENERSDLALEFMERVAPVDVEMRFLAIEAVRSQNPPEAIERISKHISELLEDLESYEIVSPGAAAKAAEKALAIDNRDLLVRAAAVAANLRLPETLSDDATRVANQELQSRFEKVIAPIAAMSVSDEELSKTQLDDIKSKLNTLWTFDLQRFQGLETLMAQWRKSPRESGQWSSYKYICNDIAWDLRIFAGVEFLVAGEIAAIESLSNDAERISHFESVRNSYLSRRDRRWDAQYVAHLLAKRGLTELAADYLVGSGDERYQNPLRVQKQIESWVSNDTILKHSNVVDYQQETYFVELKADLRRGVLEHPDVKERALRVANDPKFSDARRIEVLGRLARDYSNDLVERAEFFEQIVVIADSPSSRRRAELAREITKPGWMQSLRASAAQFGPDALTVLELTKESERANFEMGLAVTDANTRMRMVPTMFAWHSIRLLSARFPLSERIQSAEYLIAQKVENPDIEAVGLGQDPIPTLPELLKDLADYFPDVAYLRLKYHTRMAQRLEQLGRHDEAQVESAALIDLPKDQIYVGRMALARIQMRNGNYLAVAATLADVRHLARRNDLSVDVSEIGIELYNLAKAEGQDDLADLALDVQNAIKGLPASKRTFKEPETEKLLAMGRLEAAAVVSGAVCELAQTLASLGLPVDTVVPNNRADRLDWDVADAAAGEVPFDALIELAADHLTMQVNSLRMLTDRASELNDDQRWELRKRTSSNPKLWLALSSSIKYPAFEHRQTYDGVFRAPAINPSFKESKLADASLKRVAAARHRQRIDRAFAGGLVTSVVDELRKIGLSGDQVAERVGLLQHAFDSQGELRHSDLLGALEAERDFAVATARGEDFGDTPSRAERLGNLAFATANQRGKESAMGRALLEAADAEMVGPHIQLSNKWSSTKDIVAVLHELSKLPEGQALIAPALAYAVKQNTAVGLGTEEMLEARSVEQKLVASVDRRFEELRLSSEGNRAEAARLVALVSVAARLVVSNITIASNFGDGETVQSLIDARQRLVEIATSETVFQSKAAIAELVGVEVERSNALGEQAVQRDATQLLADPELIRCNQVIAEAAARSNAHLVAESATDLNSEHKTLLERWGRIETAGVEAVNSWLGTLKPEELETCSSQIAELREAMSEPAVPPVRTVASIAAAEIEPKERQVVSSAFRDVVEAIHTHDLMRAADLYVVNATASVLDKVRSSANMAWDQVVSPSLERAAVALARAQALLELKHGAGAGAGHEKAVAVIDTLLADSTSDRAYRSRIVSKADDALSELFVELYRHGFDVNKARIFIKKGDQSSRGAQEVDLAKRAFVLNDAVEALARALSTDRNQLAVRKLENSVPKLRKAAVNFPTVYEALFGPLGTDDFGPSTRASRGSWSNDETRGFAKARAEAIKEVRTAEAIVRNAFEIAEFEVEDVPTELNRLLSEPESPSRLENWLDKAGGAWRVVDLEWALRDVMRGMPEAPDPSGSFEAALTFEARSLLAEFAREPVETDIFAARANNHLSSAKEKWAEKHTQGVAKLDDGVTQRISEAAQANDVPVPVNRTPDVRDTSPKLGEVGQVKTQSPNNGPQSKDAGLDGPDDGPEPEGPQLIDPGPTPKPIGPKSGPSGGAPTPERTQPTHLKTDASAPSSPKSPETRLKTDDSPKSQRQVPTPEQSGSAVLETPQPTTHPVGSIDSEPPAPAPRPRPAPAREPADETRSVGSTRPRPAPRPGPARKPADGARSVGLAQPRPIRSSDVGRQPDVNRVDGNSTRPSLPTPVNTPVEPAPSAGSTKPLKSAAPRTPHRVDLETPETATMTSGPTTDIETVEEAPKPEVAKPAPNRWGSTLELR